MCGCAGVRMPAPALANHVAGGGEEPAPPAGSAANHNGRQHFVRERAERVADLVEGYGLFSMVMVHFRWHSIWCNFDGL